MTYALRIKKTTGGKGEQEILANDPLQAAALSKIEENTNSFILKYLKKEWRILEAGCGLGRWIIYLDESGFKVSGIDISADAINTLRKIKPELDLKIANVSSMPFSNNEFDAVLSVGVVEHDPNGPSKLLEEMKRVVRNDGILILVVPVENVLRKLVHRPYQFARSLIYSLMGKSLEFEEFRFSKSDIINHVQKAGWSILEISWVELIAPEKCYSLWVDWGGLFRNMKSNEPFELNWVGRMLKKILLGISPWTIAEGIIIVAERSDAA